MGRHLGDLEQLARQGGRPCGPGLGRSLVLASPVCGRLLSAGGTPLKGVRVRRCWSWVVTGRSDAEETTTDAEGRFSFGEVRRRAWGAAAMPHTPGVRQEIVAWPEGRETLLMRLQKANYEINGERDGRPMRLLCHLDAVPEAQGAVWGACSFED